MVLNVVRPVQGNSMFELKKMRRLITKARHFYHSTIGPGSLLVTSQKHAMLHCDDAEQPEDGTMKAMVTIALCVALSIANARLIVAGDESQAGPFPSTQSAPDAVSELHFVSVLTPHGERLKVDPSRPPGYFKQFQR